MIACISPSIYDVAQTRQTLNYALTTGIITSKSSSFGLTYTIKTIELNKAFIRSKRIIAEYYVNKVTRSVVIPNMEEINKSIQDLRNLTFMKVEWYGIDTLSITLNDG